MSLKSRLKLLIGTPVQFDTPYMSYPWYLPLYALERSLLHIDLLPCISLAQILKSGLQLLTDYNITVHLISKCEMYRAS